MADTWLLETARPWPAAVRTTRAPGTVRTTLSAAAVARLYRAASLLAEHSQTRHRLRSRR